MNARESIACKAGYYSPEGETNCTMCPSGKYSGPSASFCIRCPAGNECIDPSASPVNCSEGYIAALGDGVCKRCDVGGYRMSGFTILNHYTVYVGEYYPPADNIG